MINIPSTIEDPAYRYKMPKMELKQESRLNGVKTNIFNVADVASALRVPEDFIIKFMCAELGVGKEKKSIIKGSHPYEILIDVLDSFIIKFIICPKCKLPEVSLFAEKKKLLKGACRACGKISTLDSGHKISNHIIRNIPKDMSEIDLKLKVGDEDEGKGKKGKKGKKSKNDEENKEDELSLETHTKEENLTFESKEVEETIETIAEIIKEKGEEYKTKHIVEEIVNQCISIGAEKDIKYYIAFNALFTVDVLIEFNKYKSVFKTLFTQDGEEGVKAFVMSMVNFFIVKNPKLEVAIPSFLKHAYDADILEEDVLLKWEEKKFKTLKKSSLYDKKTEKKFKKKAEKFFSWLKEAEEDESEESEEETKEELTEEELKAQKMRELIEKEKKKQEEELAEIKAKKDEEEEKKREDNQDKVDVLNVEVNQDEADFDIDDI
mmetsp:Transcript_10162/g.8966  ORF Transcript_10162/g.8966 Transcript_10162/m.8966 type:complete len:436 (-) Transcript_10162:40-1347(-)